MKHRVILLLAILACTFLVTELNAQNVKVGVVDTKGKVVIPFEYNSIGEFCKRGFALATQNNKLGLIDSKGKTIIPFVYDELDYIPSEGLLVAEKNEEWGVLNLNNVVLIPFSYSRIRGVDMEDGLLLRMMDKQIELVNYDGNVVHRPKGSYDFAEMVGAGLIAVPKGKAGLYAVIDYKGNDLNPMGRYNSVRKHKGSNVAKVEKCPTRQTWFFGLIDSKGKLIAPVTHNSLDVNDNGSSCGSRSNKMGAMDVNGKVIIPFVHYRLRYAEPDRYMTEKRISDWKSVYGLVDTTGKVVVPIVYSNLTYIEDGYYAAEKIGTNGKSACGIIDRNGKVIIPCDYDTGTTYFAKDNVAKVRKGLSYGLMDNNAKPLTPFVYDDIGMSSEGMIAVVRNQKGGVIDAKGNEVTEVIYNGMLPYSEGLATMKKGEEMGVIDRSGKFVIPLGSFQYISSYINGVSMVYDGNKIGLIDRTGNYLIQPQYSEMTLSGIPDLYIAKK